MSESELSVDGRMLGEWKPESKLVYLHNPLSVVPNLGGAREPRGA